MKEKGMIICYIVNRCLVMFLRGGKVIAIEYWWSIVVKGQQVSTLQMGQQPEIKNINVVLGQLFYRQCKAQFFFRYRLILLMIKISNTKEKALINLHCTCYLTQIFGNLREQYFRGMQSTSWLFEGFRVWFFW